jgi:hypothetical protein
LKATDVPNIEETMLFNRLIVINDLLLAGKEKERAVSYTKAISATPGKKFDCIELVLIELLI